MQEYADRGVFRGFSRGESGGGRAAFRLVWHRDRPFDVVLDTGKGTIQCPLVLPQVPADSEMYRGLKAFIKSRQSEEVPEHRRIDRSKARATCANRGGNVAVTVKVLDGDYEYGVRKFVHLVHEIFLAFLAEHFDYQVEAFGLDPDQP